MAKMKTSIYVDRELWMRFRGHALQIAAARQLKATKFPTGDRHLYEIAFEEGLNSLAPNWTVAPQRERPRSFKDGLPITYRSSFVTSSEIAPCIGMPVSLIVE